MIYKTAYYQVKKDSIERVKKAIQEFTLYVKENEPDTLLYIAWQKKEDPTCFMHFFIFKDKHAEQIHSQSEAVKTFGSVYGPALVSDGVDFTDYDMIATNSPE